MTPRAKAAADRIAARMKGKDATRLLAFINDPEQRKRIDEEVLADSIVSTIRAAIEESELSRYEIAKRTGLTQGFLSKVVKGERTNMTVETLAKLCIELGVTVTLKRSTARRRR
jgi:DNA-binding Xre family transcriptional regulator